MKLSKYEKEILWWFFCGNSMRTFYPAMGATQNLYIISDKGTAVATNITEDTVLSLVNNAAILPVELSVKEWKVQVALGVAGNTKFILTELGARVGTEHTDWSDEFRAERITERIGIEKYAI